MFHPVRRLLLTLLPAAALAAPPPYELVTRRATDAPERATGPGTSLAPFFSVDGRWLYFTSEMFGPGLEAALPGTMDALRRDLNTGALELLSPRLPGAPFNPQGVTALAASLDDRWVLLEGGAVLMPGDTNGTSDVFIRDTVQGVTELISVNAAGTGPGNAASDSALMTPEGRWVLFRSWATDLVAKADANTTADVYLRDRQTGQTRRLSEGPAGQAELPAHPVHLAADAARAVFVCVTGTLADTPADTVPTDLHIWTANPPLLRRVGLPKPAPGELLSPLFTTLTFAHEEADDGRHLLFRADRFGLVQEGATNWYPAAAWRLDLESGGLVRLAEESLAATGAPGEIRSIHGLAASADAARIALNLAVFAADGSNLVRTVRLWEGGVLRPIEDFLLTVPPGGAPAPASLADAQLTPDGTRLIFLSQEPDVVPGAPGGDWELYVRDLATGQTRALSAPDGNFRGGVNLPETALGADGRVAFGSSADGLVPGDQNRSGDIYFTRLEGGPLELASAWPQVPGVRAASGSSSFSRQAISHDGGRILFASFADDLLPGTRIPTRQAYVLDRPTGQMLLVAVNTNGQPSHLAPDARELSADGRFVLFLSQATDLASDDTNNAPDVFVRDLQTGVTELVSRSPVTGRTPVGGVTSAILSANGRTVVYAFTDRNHFQPALTGPAPFHALWDRVTGTHRPVGTNLSLRSALALSGDGGTLVMAGLGSAGIATAAGGWTATPLPLPGPTLFSPLMALNHDGSILAVNVTDRGAVLTNLVTGASAALPAQAGGPAPASELRLTPSGRHLLARLSPGGAWFWLDFETGASRALNRRADGTVHDMSDPRMDHAGRFVVFNSVNDDLVPGDRNGAMDVFLLDLRHDTLSLLSRGPDGRSPAGMSLTPAISGDGRWVAFLSSAPLVEGDVNGLPDVYLTPVEPWLPLRLLGIHRHADGTLRLPWRGPAGPPRRLVTAGTPAGPWVPAAAEAPAGTDGGEFAVPPDPGVTGRFFKIEDR